MVAVSCHLGDICSFAIPRQIGIRSNDRTSYLEVRSVVSATTLKAIRKTVEMLHLE